MKKIILASQSPRRREILLAAGIDHSVIPSNADENISAELPRDKYVMELALLKGAEVAKNAPKDHLVISADTIVVFEDEIMGKPKDFDDAKNMLGKLSGKWHSVLTGYCVIDTNTGAASVRYERTEVKFREITQREILLYVQSGECMDKAGAYGIQDRGRIFVEKIDGDFFNVVGLPICALGKMLKDDFGFDIL